MMATPIKDLLSIPRQAIFNIPDQDISILYNDNVEVLTSKKYVVFDRYCHELFLLYPNTPITSQCTIKSVIGSGFYNADTHIRLLETIFKHVCDFNHLQFYYQKEPLLKLIYQTVNNIYNEIVQRVSDSVSTIDATDFVSLVRDDAISTIHKNIKPSPEYVERAYKEIKSYVNNGTIKNRFVQAYRSKAINENQANQCIGPRGFVTDLDRTVFKQPILNGFIRGMGNLYEIITESRTAAKSLNANDTHIKTSEYASRRVQLLTMSVMNVENTDCGSTEYFHMLVTKENLENLKGKYYFDDTTQQLGCINGTEENLIGQILKFRTALRCKTLNPYNVCTTCLGKVSENFKENSNLGYTMTSSLMEKLTQSILSTKHLTHSVKKSLIHLEDSAKKYFHNDQENNIYFNPDINLKGLHIILPNSKMSKLIDVLNLQHTNISLSKVGELDIIAIKDMNHRTPVQETVTVSYKDRLSIITKYFLEYIKSVKIESDSRGNFVIPLEGFNKEFPIFSNPLKETNIISFVNKIASMIETNKDKVSDPFEKLDTIFNTVIEQFKCNFTVIEVIVYATTTKNAFNNDYRLGRSPTFDKSETKVLLFRHRSASALLVYEDQISELIKQPVTTFSYKHRTKHPMDVLFVGSEVLKHE